MGQAKLRGTPDERRDTKIDQILQLEARRDAARIARAQKYRKEWEEVGIGLLHEFASKSSQKYDDYPGGLFLGLYSMTLFPREINEQVLRGRDKIWDLMAPYREANVKQNREIETNDTSSQIARS